MVFFVELEDLVDLIDSSMNGPVQNTGDKKALHLFSINVQLLYKEERELREILYTKGWILFY